MALAVVSDDVIGNGTHDTLGSELLFTTKLPDTGTEDKPPVFDMEDAGRGKDLEATVVVLLE